MTLPTIAGVQSRIQTIPNRPEVMLAPQLAEVFDTTAKVLMQGVRRNQNLFTEEFLIELTEEEYREKLPQIGATSQGKRHDLTHYGFTEGGCLLAASVLRTDRARQMLPIMARAFLGLREHRASSLRHEACIDKQEYIGRSNLRKRIAAAAEAGQGYTELWARWGCYSHRVLTGEIEAMRVRGYIGPDVLTTPLYIVRELEYQKAHAAMHVEDAKQLRLGLEG